MTSQERREQDEKLLKEIKEINLALETMRGENPLRRRKAK